MFPEVREKLEEYVNHRDTLTMYQAMRAANTAYNNVNLPALHQAVSSLMSRMELDKPLETPLWQRAIVAVLAVGGVALVESTDGPYLI